jgi:hypothetical protein
MKVVVAVLLMGLARLVCHSEDGPIYALIEVEGKPLSSTKSMDAYAKEAGIEGSELKRRMSSFLARLGMYFEGEEREVWLYRWSRSETNVYVVGLKNVLADTGAAPLSSMFFDALTSNRLYMYWNINEGPTLQIERLREEGREMVYARLFGTRYEYLPFWLFGRDEAFRDYLAIRHKMKPAVDGNDGYVLRVEADHAVGEMRGMRDEEGRIAQWEARINGVLFQRITHSEYGTNDSGVPTKTLVEYFAFGSDKPIKTERYRVAFEPTLYAEPWNAILPFTNRIHGHDYRSYRDILVDTNLNWVLRK